MSKLLCLCDTPTRDTGFGRVAQNLLPFWLSSFERIDIWGINFEGWPHELPYRIFPAARYSQQLWHTPENLGRFLKLLEFGGYSHLWMMQDLFQLSPIADYIQSIAKARGIRTVLYFPVDAPLEPAWVEIAHAVDVPVAYCEYGRRETLRACIDQAATANYGGVVIERSDRRGALNAKLRMLPHGVNREIYFPMDRDEARNKIFVVDGKPVFGPDDFLILNVNMHQRRKGLVQTLEIARELTQRSARDIKLYLHCKRVNVDEGCDLLAVAKQLGMNRNVFFAPDSIWPKGLEEADLNVLYNAADLLLTTSLGEGWGLPITEAMACGTPVAGPEHTSIGELLSDARGVTFKAGHLDWTTNDNSRLRQRSDVQDAAAAIHFAMQRDLLEVRAQRASEWVKKLSWAAIAKEWLEILEP